MENMKEKQSCHFLFSLPDMKVTLKQLSEVVLETSILKFFKHIERK